MNTYGATKLLMEKLFVTASNYLQKERHQTKFVALRYGNVLGSSGSVIPKFIQQIKNKEKITITDPLMTRFSITMNEALDFILKATEISKGSEIFIPKLQAYTISGIKDALFDLLENTGDEIIGIREGEKLNEVLEPHLFPDNNDGIDPKKCPKCGKGRLSMKTARSGGAFIGCDNYPECRYTRIFGPPNLEGSKAELDGKLLGQDFNENIILRKGRYGFYVQRGEISEELPKPQSFSVPKSWDAAELTLEKALKLLSLPRKIGFHPEDNEVIQASIGPYGAYIKHNKIYANIPNIMDIFDIGMNRAVEELSKKIASRNPSKEPIKHLGEYPEKGGTLLVMNGRYGPYIKWGKINATIPKDIKPADITLAIAIELVDKKSTKKSKIKKKTHKNAKSKKVKQVT